ncbi:MAG: FlgD immunoglobulin-like domain containing protein [Candidatus Krumholzibacteriia bacterium]
MRTLRPFLIAALALLTAGLAHGQVATVLVTEGAPLPNAPDYTVSSLSNTDVNGAEGWSFVATTTAAGGLTISLAYGTPLGGAPAVLRTEATYPEYEQTAWEAFYGMSDTDVAYSPTCTRLADGETGLDSVWYGDAIVAMEETPYPHQDGWWWRFASRPGVTRDGVPYFVGGITDSQGGATLVRGLFYGPDGAPVIIGGMNIIGLPDPVITNTSAVSFDFRFSAYGSHSIAEVDTDTDANFNSHVVIDGAVALAGGLPLSEGGAVPESIGGLPGEVWDNWDYMGVTESGQWLVTGDTAGPTDQDEFLMLDGQIILREGDLVDGMALTGAIERAYLGEDGDWAVAWDVMAPEGAVDALILNGQVVLMQGMPVDIDGDMVPEVGTMITDFTGLAAMAVSDRDPYGRVRVLFLADVEVPGAGRPSSNAPALAGDAAGVDEDEVVEGGSREVVGFGLMYTSEATVAIEDPEQPGDVPAAAVALAQNVPNPFNPLTKIAFSLARTDRVSLAVYDLQGRLVRTLVDGVRPAGRQEITWNGTDAAGQRLASGTYVYRLRTSDRLLSRTMTLVK